MYMHLVETCQAENEALRRNCTSKANLESPKPQAVQTPKQLPRQATAAAPVQTLPAPDSECDSINIRGRVRGTYVRTMPYSWVFCSLLSGFGALATGTVLLEVPWQYRSAIVIL